MTTWVDQTVRLKGEPEVDMNPDGEIEVSWQIPELPGSRVTLLLDPDGADKLRERVEQIVPREPVLP